ncbi:MAG: hypothetical protein IPH07_22825 [Deltaproteobacteria bacterium]|nr:hypothetical protein [Deltaproteobacteria bacterium]MBK8714186.1 hypothetical protein [Deltaproteobacteria bacterium]MBP7291653.1 hypothetical protein [Nannocystaceae bacterium]
MAATVVAACNAEQADRPALDYEGERVRVGTELSDYTPLCRGDLDALDRRVALVEERLAVRRGPPIDIYLMEFDEIPCSGDLLGCYRRERDRDEIFTTWSAVHHEVVHAAARELQFASLFWSEGAAEVLSGRSTRREMGRVLTPDDLVANHLDTYLSASHFSRYLVERHGWNAYGRIVRGDTFEDALGGSAQTVLTAYEDDAPYAYPPLDPCPYPEIPEIDDATWQAQVTVDCTAPDTTQMEWVEGSSSPLPATFRRIDLSAGTYAFELSPAGSFFLVGCHTDPLDAPTTLPSNGDLFNEADQGFGTEFPHEGVHVLKLTAGVYRVAIQAPVLVPFEAELVVHRVE